MHSGTHKGCPYRKSNIITHNSKDYGKQITLGKNPQHHHHCIDCRSNHFRFDFVPRDVNKKAGAMRLGSLCIFTNLYNQFCMLPQKRNLQPATCNGNHFSVLRSFMKNATCNPQLSMQSGFPLVKGEGTKCQGGCSIGCAIFV